MYIIRFKNFRGYFPYRRYNIINSKDVFNTPETTTASNTAITEIPEGLVERTEIEGKGLKKKRLAEKFKTLNLNNPENKLKKFINLKL